ncbi:HlyD family secretion protein [Posidoniimonas polymericola]|uniref:HlyD family secretion protein n=1 Tax=Posidoniimonas polymericola TaxID=2528002 RepID=A0A5C5XV04_9BACT|nr:efflux RND transporter periplasmic adaptor subunit [Posidoniimonas polymericola]TWT66754.1 HlyD family secretion protein [Posidoniimonas polymericola]
MIVLGLSATAAFMLLKDRLPGIPGDGSPVVAATDDHQQEAGHANEATASPALQVSKRGLQNIGYEPYTVAFREYERRLVLPAIVVERPGKSQTHITAPLTGIVTSIEVVQGQAVTPGTLLFRLKLTHEELVGAQRDFLQDLANLEVVEREVARLKELGDGVVAGKRIIEQQYERRKLRASLAAEEQAMLLHGLTKEQVRSIRESQELLPSVDIFAPGHTHGESEDEHEHPLVVQRLGISVGQQVQVGEEMAVLADHHLLQIEGAAFEDDAEQVRESAAKGRAVTARLVSGDNAAVSGLKIQYVAGQVDPVSRAFKIYLNLPNKTALDKTTDDGVRFFEWLYKPGQRMQIDLVVERTPGQLVLPAAAVVSDGAENYVYRQNGGQFQQTPVHLLSRDKEWVVAANDGALYEGDVIAGRGAYQLHLALKNQAGGGVDPHAGHNH